MADPSNNVSFIPKRGPSRRKQAPRGKNQLFLFTIITYSLLFAALIAATAVFLYKNYVTSQLQSEAAALKNAAAVFKDEDLNEARTFDITLKRATNRIENAASIVAVLDAIDVATVEPVQINGLTIARNGDNSFKLSGSVETTSFDAAIFQRKLLNVNRRIFQDVTVDSISVAELLGENESVNTNQDLLVNEVLFEVTAQVPLDEVRYDPAKARRLPESESTLAPASEGSLDTGSQTPESADSSNESET